MRARHTRTLDSLEALHSSLLHHKVKRVNSRCPARAHVQSNLHGASKTPPGLPRKLKTPPKTRPKSTKMSLGGIQTSPRQLQDPTHSTWATHPGYLVAPILLKNWTRKLARKLKNQKFYFLKENSNFRVQLFGSGKPSFSKRKTVPLLL